LLSAGPPHRKLYLSRSATSRRRIQNEAEVLEVLTPVGFECVRPETLSVREQIALFSQASHIVGPSGAAMTNMLFAPAGAHVVVLLTRHLVNGGGDAYFDALAQSCNHKARIEACEPVRLTPGKRAIDADVVVDIAKLLEALS
jgi:capsular polysaccharide biosynthesis protein